MNKTFEIQTKIGKFTAKVNGPNSLYLEGEFLYRGEIYRANAHGAINGENFDLQTYGSDGNKMIFCSQTENSWTKNKSVYSNRPGIFEEASQAAKQKFREVFVESVNQFLTNSGEELRAAWIETDKQKQKQDILLKYSKIRELKKVIEILNGEIESDRDLFHSRFQEWVFDSETGK